AIREVFRKARLYAPAVIFMDEIDAIAPVRGFAYDSGVSERVVSQLITEMDGIEKLENVVVIAATNRPDILDPALLRPGRFDKLIYVPPPDLPSRLEILKIHTRNMPLADDVDLYELAKRTEGYSGADIEALVREAALIAIREDLMIDRVYMRHFNEALNKVKPSITQEMIKFYIEWGEKAKQKLPKEHLRPQVYT
ncbi:ATP-binding protein, partial [Thermogladius sp.]|uniref:ATP-binding protein n=1 Tax=Thermogladius sp. TaxID=2023064 RepID=UPI003D0BC2A4